MAWTYGNDPISGGTAAQKRDAVRFLTQDTDTNRQLATDEEVTFALAEEHNVYTAAAAVLDSIIYRLVGIASKKIGDLSITFNLEKALARVERLRARGRAQYEVPINLAQSKDSKTSLVDDTDWVEPFFERKQHDFKSFNAETEQET